MAGKDRTGLIVALVLSSVGVGREDIVDNYNLSRFALDALVDNMYRHEDCEDFVPWSSERLPREQMMIMVGGDGHPQVKRAHR
jgi:hypothetical protein